MPRLCGFLITRITTNIDSDLCLSLYECLGKDLLEENLEKLHQILRCQWTDGTCLLSISLNSFNQGAIIVRHRNKQ